MDKHKHHKQPQFYLKGFSTGCACPQTPAEFVERNKNETIWVYEKGKPFSDNNPKCKGTSNVAFTTNFYAFENADGTMNYNKYEDLLMKDFEQPANPVIDKIRNIKKTEYFISITEEDKEKLSKYVASMIARSVQGKEFSKKALKDVTNMLEENPSDFTQEDPSNITKEDVLKVKDALISTYTNREPAIESIIDTANYLTPYITRRKW